MKVYVDPIDYWRDGYNLLDVAIIIIIFIPHILRKVKDKHYPYFNIADGIQSLRILKLITYSRGIRVSAALAWEGRLGQGWRVASAQHSLEGRGSSPTVSQFRTPAGWQVPAVIAFLLSSFQESIMSSISQMKKWRSEVTELWSGKAGLDRHA